MYDPQVVDKIRKGDGKALKQLFKSEYVKLFALAYRLVGDREFAQKIIYAVFEHLWQRREDLNPLEPLPALLQKQVFEVASRSERNGVHARGVSEGDAPHIHRLIQALDSIEDVPRLIFLLHHADGFTYREIARLLDLSEETVMHYMGRALAGLEPYMVQPGVA